MKNTTIHFLSSNTLKAGELERLFAGLELFANLGDSFQEYSDFARKFPTFCPVFFFSESADKQLDLLQNENAHELFMLFRDYLRAVWRREPAALREQVLLILLGAETKPLGAESLELNGEENDHTPGQVGTVDWDDRLETRSKSMFSNFPPRYRRALMLMRVHDDSKYFRPYFPRIMSDWESGELFCDLRTDFQRAVYHLFRQSWRARICRECQRLFIATKHPQVFCSTDCSMAVKLRRNRAFWKNEGTVQRRKRNQARRRSSKKAK